MDAEHESRARPGSDGGQPLQPATGRRPTQVVPSPRAEQIGLTHDYRRGLLSTLDVQTMELIPVLIPFTDLRCNFPGLVHSVSDAVGCSHSVAQPDCGHGHQGAECFAHFVRVPCLGEGRERRGQRAEARRKYGWGMKGRGTGEDAEGSRERRGEKRIR